MLDFYEYLQKKNYSEAEVLAWRAIPPGHWTNLPPVDKLPRFSFMREGDVEEVLYAPTRVGRLFHSSPKPNVILEGPRGTGKSTAIRFDAHMRAMSTPGWSYLILRRQMGDLEKSHLIYMDREMERLGGSFNNTTRTAYYPNGSIGFFTYCVHLKDIMNLLSSQYGGVYFDEITTFLWEMVTKIGACARVPEDSGLVAFVRGGTNPLGIGAKEIRDHYITKVAQEPSYNPDDYEAIRTRPEDNPYIDWDQYRKRLGTLDDRSRRAWLEGEWLNEGAYFTEFKPTRIDTFGNEQPWHVIKELPIVNGRSLLDPQNSHYVRLYRSVDWGFRPDPAVCHWYAKLPTGHTIVFKERKWLETVAADVGAAIKRESEGMQIVDTFGDPTMFAKKGDTEFSISERFEGAGVMLTPSINNRTTWGTAICEQLNIVLDDGESQHPQLQILDQNGRLGCPDLIRTLPDMRTDPNDLSRIDDGGDDHWVASLAYYCMGHAPAPRDPDRPSRPRWMMGKREFARSFPSRL